jgi:predicted amidohydrolase
VHVPDEPGFWESLHYEPGDRPPVRIDHFAMPLGVQICSDVNRPTGSLQLGALGAELIVVPRATEATTFEPWRTVMQANALTSCCYVVCVNRPRPELGVPFGGPSIAIAPDGEVLTETAETLCVVELSRQVARRARAEYPGYLAEPAGLYAEGWRAVSRAVDG